VEQGGDTYLTSKPGVLKAEKEKMITTLARGNKVIWGELDLVRRLLAARRGGNIQGRYGYIGKCLLKDPKSQRLMRKSIRRGSLSQNSTDVYRSECLGDEGI